MFNYRNFPYKHRSERTVATEPSKKTKFYLFYKLLALPKSASQVSQAEYFYAKKLQDLFKNKINKTPIKIQSIFSFQNLHTMFIHLSYVMNVQISRGYNKNNLFTLLSDPCYFLYCYSLLKQDTTRGINNTIFSEILSLSI